MPCPPDRLLITYYYDALDRLAGCMPTGQPHQMRFYQKDRLVTELQGNNRIQFFQSQNELLAERHNRSGQCTSLLITDRQRSVLRVLDERLAYTPYGYSPMAGGSASLLGFNGERADSTTGHYLLGNGHRAFSPRLMRFSRSDSLSPFGKGGLNSYAYCGGDPVTRSDPAGRWFGWAWFTSNLVQMAADYLPPLIPQRVARWIPGIANPTLGRWAKHINKVSNFSSGLSYIPVSVIDNVAFTEKNYGIALATHLFITTVSIFSGIVWTLHEISTKGTVPVQLTGVRSLRDIPSTSATISYPISLSSSRRALRQTGVTTTASEIRTGIRQ